MVCPLCRSQYVGDVRTCKDCRTALMKEDAPIEERNPPRAIFPFASRENLEKGQDLLAEAGVPHRVVVQGEHWIERLLGKPTRFEIHVFTTDQEGAQQATGGLSHVAVEPPPLAPENLPHTRCPSCREVLPKGYYAACPACGLELSTGPSSASEFMAGSPEDPPDVVWRGSDPIAFGRALSILREAGIAEISAPTSDHMTFGMAVARPMLQIRTHRSDAARARELLAECVGAFPFAIEEADSATRPSTDSQEGRVAGENATGEVEIWSGVEPQTAHWLRTSLQEVGVHSRTQVEGRVERISVPPECAAQAREVASAVLSGVQGSSAEPLPVESLAKRKRFLQIGAGLCILGYVLLPWQASPPLPAFEPVLNLTNVQVFAFRLLGYAASLSRNFSFLFLLLAWNLRWDKLGRLSVLFMIWSLMGLALDFVANSLATLP